MAELTEAEREAAWILDPHEIERTLVEEQAYYVEWLKEQHGPDSLLVKMEIAALNAGRAALNGGDNDTG